MPNPRLHLTAEKVVRCKPGVGTPPPAPVTEAAAAQPVIVVPGERVLDERPGPDDKFAMAGGAHLAREAYGDDTRAGGQGGYDAAEEYDPDTDRAADAELAAVVNATGGGTVKARKR